MAIRGKQFALSRPAPVAAVAQVQSARQAEPKANGEINLDNILKLIPGEVVPLYITAIGLAVVPVHGWTWPTIVFWICLLACALLRGIASKPVGTAGLTGVNWRLVLVSVLAFFLWAHAVSTPGPVVDWFPAPAWGFFAAILGLFAPKFVPAQ